MGVSLARSNVKRLVGAGVLMCALIVATPLHAAQPYVTDDARLIPAGACQLEAGRRTGHGSHDYWLLPACNIGGNLELTLGANRAYPPEGDRATDVVLQAKSLFRELKPDDYGWGWVANLEMHRHPQPGEARTGSIYAAGLFSRSFFGETLIVHANAGVRRLRDQETTASAWGLQAEVNVNERIAVIAEQSDTTRTPRALQAGLWFSLVPDRLELDVSVGGEARDFRRTRYWTIGLRVITAPFLK